VGTEEGVSPRPSAGSPEIPTFDGRVLVIGRVVAHRSILSASERSIYSETDVTAEMVFESGPTSLIAGSTISILVAGGTVRLPNGQVISFLTQPRAFSIQTGRVYLMALRWYPKGDFYALRESWDLTSGTVQPNSRLGVWRKENGGSRIIGLSRLGLTKYLAGK